MYTTCVQTLRYRFRVYPTAQQEANCNQLFGCVRWVFNEALKWRSEAYKKDKTHLGYKETSKLLTAQKQEPDYEWLQVPSCVPLQQSLRHLDSAFTRFFKKQARYPAVKRKGHRQSAEFTRSAFTLENGQLTLAKLGKVKVKWSRKLPTLPSTITLIKEPSGRYYISCVVRVKTGPLPATYKPVGIDLGLKTLATLSDKLKIENPRFLKQNLKRLKREQRKLSRRTKGSGRWHSQRLRVSRMQEYIRNSRKDWIDKVTTYLVRTYDVITIETLNIKGMVKNRKLARSLMDAALGMFKALLVQKAARYGRELLMADPFFASSKFCSNCGHKYAELKLSERVWTCEKCGVTHDRDDNASNNLLNYKTFLAVGHTATAQGGHVRPATLDVEWAVAIEL